jgi:hypothetical protein
MVNQVQTDVFVLITKLIAAKVYTIAAPNNPSFL